MSRPVLVAASGMVSAALMLAGLSIICPHMRPEDAIPYLGMTAIFGSVGMAIATRR